MNQINLWKSVNKEGWSFQKETKFCDFFTYKVDALPDFSDPRFLYLGEKADGRPGEMAKKQLQMIRRMHTLGAGWAISMRIKKTEEGIALYFVFRHAGERNFSLAEIEKYKEQIQSMFLEEYTTVPAKETEKEDLRDISWANFSGETFKQEDLYAGNIVSNYYSCSLWTGAANDMQMLCSSLLKQRGKAVIEITLVPTAFLPEEREWVNNCTQQLKEVQMGERIRNDAGKVLMQYDPNPSLAGPVDNYNKVIKRYETSRVFLTSLRIFSEGNIENLVSAFQTGAVRNRASVRIFEKGNLFFKIHQRAYENVDISVEVNSVLWNQKENPMPFRAQRLNRLSDVEEIANFFRIPMPIENHFPGFGLDTGLGTGGGKKKSQLEIELGNYVDDPSGNSVSAAFDCRQLAKHGLIVGVPGSGKTTAMFNILHQLWDAPEDSRIPFIVMEPAKTEFRALKTIPHFKDSLLVYTLGDERVSPFRFNPFEVLPGIPLERHISKLNACFVGAFDLFDPLPILLDQAIRRTYMEKGWYEDSIGGEEGVETPTLTDLCRNAEYIVNHSGFDSKMVSDFKASLLQRLNSLRRGSKGRMLDTPRSIPMEELMQKPVILELDALNEDEKSLMMMFLLSFVYEYCKVKRKSGSPLKHMLLVEEAHNLIGEAGGSDNRANPKEQTIKLFVNMLAEMRALGQGILIADQLPTAIASQAVKQTNVKILMRVTSKDDREEIGNTMDLSETEMKNVVHFKTGHAYIFHEELDRVRMVRMLNYKEKYGVEEPPDDEELHEMMAYYEREHADVYLPYKDCRKFCKVCQRRVRIQAEQFAEHFFKEKGKGSYYQLSLMDKMYKDVKEIELKKAVFPKCIYCILGIREEKKKLEERYGKVGEHFAQCAYIHLREREKEQFEHCKDCACDEKKLEHYFDILTKI